MSDNLGIHIEIMDGGVGDTPEEIDKIRKETIANTLKNKQQDESIKDINTSIENQNITIEELDKSTSDSLAQINKDIEIKEKELKEKDEELESKIIAQKEELEGLNDLKIKNLTYDLSQIENINNYKINGNGDLIINKDNPTIVFGVGYLLDNSYVSNVELVGTSSFRGRIIVTQQSKIYSSDANGRVYISTLEKAPHTGSRRLLQITVDNFGENKEIILKKNMITSNITDLIKKDTNIVAEEIVALKDFMPARFWEGREVKVTQEMQSLWLLKVIRNNNEDIKEILESLGNLDLRLINQEFGL